MKKLFLLLFVPLCSFGQVAIQKRLAPVSPGGQILFEDVMKCPDGGYLIAGYASDSTNWSAYTSFILKTDANFQEQWNYSFNYDSMSLEVCTFSQVGILPNGTYFAVGSFYNSSTSTYGSTIVNLSSTGNLIWSKNIWDPFSMNLALNSSIGVDAGGLTFSGNTLNSGGNVAYMAMRINFSGNVEWIRNCTSGDFKNPSYSSCATGDGGMIISGKSGSNIFLVRILSDGNIGWTKEFYDGQYTRAYSIIALSDGGFLIGGYCLMSNYTPFAMKIDGSGNVIWRKEYASLDIQIGDGYFTKFIELNNGQILFSMSNSWDMILGRMNQAGDILGAFKYAQDSTAFFPLYSPSSLRNTPDDNPYLSLTYQDLNTSEYVPAFMQSDWLAFSWCGKVPVTLTSNMVTWNPVVTNNSYLTEMMPVSTSQIIQPQATTSILINATDLCQNTSVALLESSPIVISPNPATTTLTISSFGGEGKAEILNSLGQLVLTHDLTHGMEIDIRSLSPGLYFLNLQDSHGTPASRKFVVGH